MSGHGSLVRISDLDTDGIGRVLSTAERFGEVMERDIKKVPTLRGRTVINLFLEPSTRTSTSFELAAKRLSADVVSIKGQGTSMDKGETLKDTILTLEAYEPDVFVARHPQVGACDVIRRYTDAAVVNAGDGTGEHPTQALLDLYTVQREVGPIEGLHVAFVGDVLHSRVARSGITAFRMMGARVTVVAPPTLVPRHLAEALGAEVSADIRDIADADIVYVLRMQLERMGAGGFVPSLEEYARMYQVNHARLRDGQRVMHAGPVNRGVEISGPVVDDPGLTVIPGIVDVHVHLRTPGKEHAEDIATGTASAAAGGVVTVLAMPNTQPPTDNPSILGSLLDRASREAVVPTGFIPAITVGQAGESLTEHGDLAEAGAAALSDDGVPVGSALVMRRALQYQKATGLLFTLHEEDMSLSGTGVMHEGVVSARIGLAGIPGVSEAVQVARDCSLAAYEDGRIHVCHVSARETVDEIRLAKARGVQVTAEVTPHHLLLTDDAVGDDPDPAKFKMNPPLRSTDDREALIEALVDGTIDCIATDHAPHPGDEKENPFAAAPFGVIGLETAFPACYTALVLGGRMDLTDLVLRMSTTPARIFGLPVPTLADGATANLALLDLAATDVVGARPYASKSTNAAFVGMELTGRVVMTLAGGQDVYRRTA